MSSKKFNSSESSDELLKKLLFVNSVRVSIALLLELILDFSLLSNGTNVYFSLTHLNHCENNACCYIIHKTI